MKDRRNWIWTIFTQRGFDLRAWTTDFQAAVPDAFKTQGGPGIGSSTLSEPLETVHDCRFFPHRFLFFFGGVVTGWLLILGILVMIIDVCDDAMRCNEV